MRPPRQKLRQGKFQHYFAKTPNSRQRKITDQVLHPSPAVKLSPSLYRTPQCMQPVVLSLNNSQLDHCKRIEMWANEMFASNQS